MEDKKALGNVHAMVKIEKEDTGSSNMADKVKFLGEPQKKKIKLDRSALNSSLSKPNSLSISSNGLKTEVKSRPENHEKKKHDGIKSPSKHVGKQGISSVKTLSTKPPKQQDSGDNDDDDTPLAARAKMKLTSSSKSHSHLKMHLANGEVVKLKSDHGKPLIKSPKKEHTNETKSDVVKVKSDGDLRGPLKTKSESSLLKSPKVDGVKKVKSESSLPGSPKADGVKKIKSETGIPASSKVDKIKIKSESNKPPSSKVDGVKKIKIESGVVVSSNADEARNKMKSSTDDSDDDVPLAARVKVKKESQSATKERKRKMSDDDDYKPLAKTKKKSDVSEKTNKKEKTKDKVKEKQAKKEKAKEKEKGNEKKEAKPKKAEEEVWKWWEEEKHPEGIKWLTLEHKGPYFPPPYEPLPDSVKFYYDGNEVKLSMKSEEVAGFYAKMLDHDYTSKKIFNDNFFEDWRKEMTDEERKLIKDLSKCNFKEMHAYYVQKNEERKNMSKEEKQKIKEKNEEILQEYGYCTMDRHKERVGNFKIEPPGLFRGRGDHPKQGKLKKRVLARDIIINIGKEATVPVPPDGQKWKSVTHDNKVTWLACWIENIQGSYKYVMLNPTSRIKGEKDWQKYETARKLKTKIGKIRNDYMNDWRAKEMRLRQRGVALYFIDKLALRAGHEKDEDTADTVGCCSLRVEHIKLHRQLNDKEFVVEFDFLGKDSIHYHNLVEVEKRVFKNLELFKQGKTDGDDLFDRLSTTSLNKYLSELMEGLSAKVFRTFNASMTLQDQLDKLELEDNVAAKVLGYNRANRAVAILCNHQRSAPKTFEQSMSNLQQKIEDKRKAIKDAKKEIKELKTELKSNKTTANEKKYEKKKSALERLKEQLFKLEVTQTDKEENKEIALGTSKLNYLDPRISIAWCRKNDVPIEKIYNKTQRQKFAWAIDMTEEDFVF